MPRSERYEKGAAKMKELFGAEPRPGMLQEDFLQITVENLFGDIWNRPGLELKERSMITVAALTVLARERELKRSRGESRVSQSGIRSLSAETFA